MAKSLTELRLEIDQADSDLLRALGQRYEAVRQVGNLKRQLGLPPLDAARWTQVVESRIDAGITYGLSPTFISGIYDLIHQEALTIESESTP